MSVINTNISSMQAQSSVRTSGLNLSTAMERLSSGVRINSAKDDAAGLAISTRMTASIRGISAAIRNANDGISLTQTAEGSLGQIGDNLQRIRELAVQSSNTGNNASDRAAMNNEAKQLVAEIDRIASNSTFNGIKLLDGTFQNQSLQVGAGNDVNDRIAISIGSAKASALGVGANSNYSATKVGSNTVPTSALTAGQLAINGYQVGATSTDGVSYAYATGSGIAKANAINAISGTTNVLATVSATTQAGIAPTTSTTAIAAGDVKINGVDIGAIQASSSVVDRGTQVTAAINAITAQTGVTATASSAGVVTLTAADGRNITVDANANGRSGSGLGMTVADATSLVTTNNTETNVVTFLQLTTGKKTSVGGLTFTAGPATVAAADVAAAFASLKAGATAGNTAAGTWSGTLTGFDTGAVDGVTVKFASTTIGTDVTDLPITATGGDFVAATKVTTQLSEATVTTFNAGLRSGGTATYAGLIFTASQDVTKEELASAFSNLKVGATTGSLTAKGAYTGTLAEFSTQAAIDNTLTAVAVSAVDATPAMTVALAGGILSNYASTITLKSSVQAGITLGGATGLTSTGMTSGTTTAITTPGAGVSSVDLTTASGSQSALTTLDSAINTITDSRAAMGAYQNRLTASIANLETTSMNLSASRSRILDTDYAKETTNLAKSQIIQQAATAMLAQANQSGQSVLALLK
jgi:flagellin